MHEDAEHAKLCVPMPNVTALCVDVEYAKLCVSMPTVPSFVCRCRLCQALCVDAEHAKLTAIITPFQGYVCGGRGGHCLARRGRLGHMNVICNKNIFI